MTDTGVDASDAANGARNVSQRLRRTRGYRILVAVGLVSYGVVYLLIAWIALRIAWGGGGDASQQGALRTLARTGAGPVLLAGDPARALPLGPWQGGGAALGKRRGG